MTVFGGRDAIAIAGSVRCGEMTASSVVRATLDTISVRDPALNSFTSVFAETALEAAAAIDRQIADGIDPGPFAGVPFSAKNLFDLAGVTTLAGSKIRRDAAPASRDATIVTRLKSAGAILVGTNNMDEFAYGFTTENAHYGPTRNPHDRARSAGGSSGGSAAAVAAGLVPLSLGSDTNGSIRVPASFCGIFGLKPTFGRLSRAGTFPFVHALDHVGPFARTVRDLALAYDLMQGADPSDPVCADRPIEWASSGLDDGEAPFRIGILDGWFQRGATADILAAVERVADALGANRRFDLDHVAEARAAAFCITASSGGALHLPDLLRRPADFDPATRDRLFAGALLPASIIDRANRIRRYFRNQLREVFRDVDILIAPTTPCTAPLLGQATLELDGEAVPLRANVGLYTQPLSFIGLPIVVVPVRTTGLPIGVQIIGAAWQERSVLRVAALLERLGVVSVQTA